VAYTQVRR